jgi:predicted DNA binding protein
MSRAGADPTRERVRAGDKWRTRYEELSAFIAQHDRFPNALHATVEERRLRSWCSTQRNARAGIGTFTLTETQVELLERLDGWTW